MAAVSIPRQPFGELGLAQLQQLSSTKNCQNAITSSLSKPSKPMEKTVLTSPPKRNIDLTIFDDDEDSENIDPVSFQNKRSKNCNGTPTIKLFPHLKEGTSTESAKYSRSPFSSRTKDSNVLGSSLGQKRKADAAAAVAAPLSAPAGRSPKHKRIGILSKKRNSLSSFRRIDPPVFGKLSHGALPFSIDEALSGTLSSHAVKAKVSTIEESMPKSWLFDIHEDTPEEEAANLMEHSAYILDISDDEGQSIKDDVVGKENIPPIGHVQSEPTSPLAEKATKSRQAALVDAMVDEGEDRLPLGDLPAIDFYDEGLDAESKVIVAIDQENAAPAKAASFSLKSDAKVTKVLTAESSVINDAETT